MTVELFMKLNYFSYLFWSHTLRGFVKVNPAFITSCSLLDNLGIILLLISPVEMKLLWIGIGLVGANIKTAVFSTTGKDARLQLSWISFEHESCCNCLSARDWVAESKQKNTVNTKTLHCAPWDVFLQEVQTQVSRNPYNSK